MFLEDGLVERWVDGAIFPCELAFFLAACRLHQVEAIIESGRQDGYSTEILGRFGQRHHVDVYSIDMEIDPIRAEQCRNRLQNLPLQLLKGNAYDLLGRKVDALVGRRTALLIDGPKSWSALSMIAAAAKPNVEVCALHNLVEEQIEWIAKYGGERYEDCIADGGPAWTELCRREAWRAAQSIARSNTPSTLGVVRFSGDARDRMAHSFRKEFGLHQPSVVRLLWQLGLYAATPKLYSLSYRVLRA